MASPGDKRFGMTGALSEAIPTAEENQMSDSLIEELKRQNNYESAADTKKRYACRRRHLYFSVKVSSLSTFDILGQFHFANISLLSDMPSSTH